MVNYHKVFLILLLAITTSFAQKCVEGRVVEVETERPIENCIVLLNEIDQKVTSMVLTDADGRFSFTEISGELAELSISKLTYDGATVGPMRVKKGRPFKFKVVLTPVPFQTGDVVVEAKKEIVELMGTGFTKRKEIGFGKYVTLEDIKKKRYFDLRQVLHNFPQIGGNIFLEPIYNKSTVSGLNGSAQISVFINGVYHDQEIPIGAIVDIDQVVGAEFYRGPATTPIQYCRFNTAAGVLLLWTK